MKFSYIKLFLKNVLHYVHANFVNSFECIVAK